MIKKTGAELTIALLEREGITQIAGIPGGTNLPLYDALGQSNIKHILARHEQGAGFIAQGMARVTGLPAVCFATSGPGATNMLTALADAMLDSIPLICITGQVPIPMIGTDAFQEVDIYGMSLPVTKHNFQIRSVAELLDVIPEAFRIATSDRPGPVLIDIPKDVQQSQLEFSSWPEKGHSDPLLAADDISIAMAVERIYLSQRPILYLGGGVVHNNGSLLTSQLAELADLPTVMSLMALGVLPHDHHLSLGMLGMHGAIATNMALHRADLLIVIGARFDDRATGKVSEFCPAAEVIHLDVDSSELSKIRSADIPLHGDVSATLVKLLPLLKPQHRPHWHAEINLLKQTNPEPERSGSLDQPQNLIRRVGEIMGPEVLITTDVGQHQMWTAQVFPFQKARHWLTSGGLGTMGFGLPAAIGAALASPKQPVVCFSGDGSILMNIQELATAAEHNLNIKLILLNNSSLGLVRQQQDLFYGGRRFASDLNYRLDFCTIARGFGWNALDLNLSDEADHQLEAALRTSGPQLIHVCINRKARVYPIVPPGGANHEMLTGENNEN